MAKKETKKVKENPWKLKYNKLSSDTDYDLRSKDRAIEDKEEEAEKLNNDISKLRIELQESKELRWRAENEVRFLRTTLQLITVNSENIKTIDSLRGELGDGRNPEQMISFPMKNFR